MQKKLIINLVALFSLAIFALVAFIPPVFALELTNNMDNFQLGDSDPVEIITNIVTIVLAFLGLIAVIIILIGGFLWMTAGGNEDKVKKAKTMMIQGLIGLIIVLAAYGVASFVIEKALDVTGAST